MAKQLQRIHSLSKSFHPTNGYLLVKPRDLEQEETSEGGIVVTLKQNKSSLERSSSGEVVHVGLGEEKDEFKLSVGDTIVWPESDGLDLKFDDGEFLLLRYKSVIGMVKS